MSSLDRLRNSIGRELSRLKTVRERERDERGDRARMRRQVRALVKATTLAQSVAARVQTKAHHEIAKIVTRALAIFDEPYEFRLEFRRVRGRTEARVSFLRDGVEVDPVLSSGGGVVLVAAFALRVACLVLARPKLRRVLVLDEPFHFTSAGYTSRVRALLRALSRDLGIQFIIVTHDMGLRAGRVIELE